MLHINIFLEELTLYLKDIYVNKLTKLMEKISLEYSLVENLTFIKIRFNDPDKIMLNMNKTAKLLADNMIPYIELGFSLNRLYIVLESRYKNDFIKLFEKYEE